MLTSTFNVHLISRYTGILWAGPALDRQYQMLRARIHSGDMGRRIYSYLGHDWGSVDKVTIVTRVSQRFIVVEATGDEQLVGAHILPQGAIEGRITGWRVFSVGMHTPLAKV